MKGFNLAERAHVVPFRYPVDLDSSQQSAITTDWINMANYGHISIIIALGVTGAATTITVTTATTNTGTSAAAMAFNYYACTTDSSDVTGSKTAATTSGFATSTNDNIFYIIEIDASELPEGSNFINVSLSDPAAATFGSVIGVLSGSRYASPASATAQS